MPRKNEKKSGDKSTKKEGMGFGDKTCFDDSLSEGGKYFYRAQIRDLEEQLEKYQHKCDDLEVQQKDFSSQYITLEKEKKDIVLYLKRSLAQKEDELTGLSEQLVGLQQAKDAERDSFEVQLSQLRQDLQENKTNLTSENRVLAGQLAALEEFRGLKEGLQAQLEAVQEQLGQQTQEHHTAVYHLERKAVLDRDRLKKETRQQAAAAEAEFRHLSEKKIPETTRRAIQENLALTTQLSQLSDQSRQLLQENEALIEGKKQLCRETEVLKPLLDQMTRKNVSSQKVVHLLTEKCKQTQEEHATSQKGLAQLQENYTTLLTGSQVLREEHALVLELSGTRGADADRLRRDLEEERDVRGQLEAILQEAAFALRQALEDSEVKTMVRRNQMLQTLMAALGTSYVIPERDSLPELKTGPGAERSGPVKAFPTSSGNVSHLKTRYLGVPRRTHNDSSILSKMGPLSQLHRKPPPQKKSSLSKLPDPDSLARLQVDPVRPILPSPSRSSPTRGSSTKPILR